MFRGMLKQVTVHTAHRFQCASQNVTRRVSLLKLSKASSARKHSFKA